jgi:hypothetical protein
MALIYDGAGGFYDDGLGDDPNNYSTNSDPNYYDNYFNQGQTQPPPNLDFSNLFNSVGQVLQDTAEWVNNNPAPPPQQQQDYSQWDQSNYTYGQQAQQPNYPDYYSQEYTAGQDYTPPSNLYVPQDQQLPPRPEQPPAWDFSNWFNPQPQQDYSQEATAQYPSNLYVPDQTPSFDYNPETTFNPNDYSQPQQDPLSFNNPPLFMGTSANMKLTSPGPVFSDNPETPFNANDYQQQPTLPDLSKIGGNYGQDYFGNTIGGLNSAVGVGIQGAGSVIRPIGETANNLADSGIPGVSQAAQVARGVYSNWTEPILSTGVSIAGDLLKPAADAARSVFDRTGVTNDLTQAKLARVQGIYNQAIASGKSEQEAQALARAEDAKTGFNDNLANPLEVPNVLANIPRSIFDRDSLTKEYTQKKTAYVQDAYNQAKAAGMSDDQAAKVAQQLDQHLGNFANLSEYEGLQKFGTFPALAQLGIMFADPIGNYGANAIAKPIMGVAGEAAGKVGEIPAVKAVGDFIAGPQKRGYAAEQAVLQLIPALEDHANVSGIPFTDLVKEFATNPDFGRV